MIYAEDVARAMELKNIDNVDLIIELVTGVKNEHIENAKQNGFDVYPLHNFDDIEREHN